MLPVRDVPTGDGERAAEEPRGADRDPALGFGAFPLRAQRTSSSSLSSSELRPEGSAPSRRHETSTSG